MRKILLICGDSNAAINFRKELIVFLIDKGFDVSIICGDSERKSDFEIIGATFFDVAFKNRSLSPLEFQKAKKQIRNIVRKLSPDIVFSFQLKPNVLGTSAAYSEGVKNIYCMVEGLGDPFQPRNFKGKIIKNVVCFLYKRTFKKAKTVFFLNNDDRNELLSRKLVRPENSFVIPGIGIDTSVFVPEPEKKCKKRVVMLSRLIKNKGIFEFCEIAKKVKEKRKDISFEIYGSESQLTKKDIESYINEDIIYYGGFTKDTVNLIKESKLMISTSFREGFPRTILEAMALNKPVISFDCVGCRDAVVDGVTGFLIPVHDIDSFANKIIKIIDDEELLNQLGKQAREICEKKYDSRIINSLIYDIITAKQ